MPIETFAAQVESIKNLTHDVRQLDLRLIEPKTIMFSQASSSPSRCRTRRPAIS